jgi:large subunit ribosomal protein L18
MHNQRRKTALRKKRALRVRKRVRGTAQRPRLSVYRSNNQISAQLIDDVTGSTLASASSLSRELRAKEGNGRNQGTAKVIGQLLAEAAKEKGVEQAVFDRGYYKYHGVVAALADGAREGGLQL